MKSLVWFRRDLRDNDNAALYHALKASCQVYCVFVFDTEILDRLVDKADRRVDFIWQCVGDLQAALEEKGGGLILLHGRAQAEIPKLARQLGVQGVYANRDYEPAAITRDHAVAAELAKNGITFNAIKDQVIFETDEVLTQDGRPYSVFTPYKNTWLKKLEPFFLKPYPVAKYADVLARPSQQTAISLQSIGFMPTTQKFPSACRVHKRCYRISQSGLPDTKIIATIPQSRGRRTCPRIYVSAPFPSVHWRDWPGKLVVPVLKPGYRN